MKYLYFRMHEYIEKQVETLTQCKANKYEDIDTLNRTEHNLRIVLSILDELVRKTEIPGGYYFPYPEHILNLSAEFHILREVLFVCMSIIYHENPAQKNLSYMTSVFSLLTPYI